MSNQTYRINRPEVIDENFEQEYVVVNLKTGTYYSLNGMGTLIWEMLGQNAPRNTIIQTLQNIFAADAELIASHTDRLLAELAQEQLIVPADPSLNPPLALTESNTRREFSPPLLEKYTDMQALLLLDPIHQVDESGWPSANPNGH